MRIIVCLIGAALSVKAIVALEHSSQGEESIYLLRGCAEGYKMVSAVELKAIPADYFEKDFSFEKIAFEKFFETGLILQSCWVRPLFRKPRDDPSHVLFEAGITASRVTFKHANGRYT